MAGSFEDLGVGLNTVVQKISHNQTIARLLRYTDTDPLNKNKGDIDLNSIFGVNVIMKPKIDLNSVEKGIVCVLCPYVSADKNDNFSLSSLEIDVVIPIDQWPINEECCLRPIKVMSEIKKIVNKSHITGIGVAEFVEATLDIPNDEISIYKMIFSVNSNG